VLAGSPLLVALLAVLAAVPVILDGVVAAVAEGTGDFGPARTHALVELDDLAALGLGDGRVVEVGL
jgi:hypothetical protein